MSHPAPSAHRTSYTLRGALLLALVSTACRARARSDPSSRDVSHPPDASASVAGPAPRPSGRDDVAVAIVALQDAFCARLASGRIACWGSGSHGQLGDGRGQGSATPCTVSGIQHATALSGAGRRACAVEDGRVLCWGGAMTGTSSEPHDARTPYAIGTETDAREVAVGWPHVCWSDVAGAVSCRVIQPGLASTASRRPLPAPATQLVGAGLAFCASTAAGVYCFRHGSVASGAELLGPAVLTLPSADAIAMTERSVCGAGAQSIACAQLDPAGAHVTVPFAGATALAFRSYDTADVENPELLAVSPHGAARIHIAYGATVATWVAPADVDALAGNDATCARTHAGAVSCGRLGEDLQRVAFDAPSLPHRAGVLSVELAHGDDYDTDIEDARLGSEGRLEFCATLTHQGSLQTRQCFALAPDATTLSDLGPWTRATPQVDWSPAGMDIVNGAQRHTLPVPRPDVGGDDSVLDAFMGHDADLVAMVVPGGRGIRSIRTLTLLDANTGATLATTRSEPHVSDAYDVAGGFFVHAYASDMVDGGTFAVDLLRAHGPLLHAGTCAEAGSGHCAWQFAPDRLAINTAHGVVTFHSPDGAREDTGFRPGTGTRRVVVDPSRGRMYAVRHQPLGAVDVFDVAQRRIVRTVAPAAP